METHHLKHRHEKRDMWWLLTAKLIHHENSPTIQSIEMKREKRDTLYVVTHSLMH